MSRLPKINRRRFLVAGVASGLVIGFGFLRSSPPGVAATDRAAGALNAWLRIAPDGGVTVVCGRSEMGQGAHAGLATLLAEELDCDWRAVRVETGPADDAFKNVYGGKALLTEDHADLPPDAGTIAVAKDWFFTKAAAAATEQFTGGSSSIRDGFVTLRRAGATARAMLVAAAAKGWGVAPAECATEDGFVLHKASGRRRSYGELAGEAAAIEPPSDVALKPRGAWRYIGKSLARPDLPAKVDGSATFGIDVRRPGMLFAAVANCPVFGGKLKSFDPAPVLKMPGIAAVLPMPGGVAVVASSTWRAMKGLRALAIVWDDGPAAAVSSATIDRQFTSALDGKTKSAFAQGDVARAAAGAAKTINAEYRLPYLAHATMEPMNCTAEVTADGVDVWVPSQVQTRARKAAAEAAGVSSAKVRIHTTYLGGGFGRRSEIDQVAQAVTLAKTLGKPVQVIWSREEDMRHDFYRPLVVSRMMAALDPRGMPVAWQQRIATQSIFARVFPPATWLGPDHSMIEGAVEMGYGVPNQSIEYAVMEAPVPVGAWRSVGHSYNAFLKECFMDEVAHAAGADPLELRRMLLADQPRLRAVLDLAAAKGDWGKPLGVNEGRGIALHLSFGSIVAEVAEVAIAADQRISVKRVVAAVDCGTVVNPAIVEAQVQSAIVYGLTAALFGKITLENGRVVQANFPDYEMLRLAQMPRIEVHIVPSEAPPGGIGEPGTPPIAPAIANAIFAATGKRVRALPLVDAGFKV